MLSWARNVQRAINLARPVAHPTGWFIRLHVTIGTHITWAVGNPGPPGRAGRDPDTDHLPIYVRERMTSIMSRIFCCLLSLVHIQGLIHRSGRRRTATYLLYVPDVPGVLAPAMLVVVMLLFAAQRLEGALADMAT